MGKKVKSEKKKSKALQKDINRNKRNNSKEYTLSNYGSIKSYKIKGLLDTFHSYTGPSITEIINSLDIKSSSKNNNNSDFRIEFPSKISNRKFFELFQKGIELAKKNYSSFNLKILKKILLLLNEEAKGSKIEDEFGLNSCLKLQKTFRIDLIFTLLSDESKIKELNIKDLSEVESKFKATVDYSLFFDDSEFKLPLLFNEKTDKIFSLNNFKEILMSPVVLKVYQEVLDELYDVKASEKEIKDLINNFIKAHDIYFMYMDVSRFGMTLYDGTIIINKIYYRSPYTVEKAFIILFTLMHELMHVISRLKRGDKNFFLNTDEFTKFKNKNYAQESGVYFDNKFLLNVLNGKYLTSLEADYLLDLKHYESKSIEGFHKAFMEFRTKNKNEIQESKTFAIAKTSNDHTFSIKIGCYCAGERKNV